jgi:tRNA A58 N-methylase Trm61
MAGLSDGPGGTFMKKLLVPYHPTPPEMARKMLEAVDVRPGETVYDLGCGKGNILIVAAEEFKANCVGIEIDEKLAEAAREKAYEKGLDDRVKIFCGDVFSPEYWAFEGEEGEKPYAIENADVLALYLNHAIQEPLIPKLLKELKKGTRIASYEFFFRGFEDVGNLDHVFIYSI